ncbi:hypothetical protein ABZ942_13145 [Nocardia sp. NPDC046473]|uniref:hypothetical protein n=1 Tax=Nocardia sp. NPDC046473 TaxID=3155733 RepID=UPI0033FF0DAB
MDKEDSTREPEPQPESDDGRPATSFDAATIQNLVYNHLPGLKGIQTATLGMDARQFRQGTRATGKITESELTEALTSYVTPDGFSMTLAALQEDRIVVLSGPSGFGKRTSALQLLRRCTEGQLVLLSPQVTATELAERPYVHGCGYAVVDHIGDNGPDGAFGWNVVRDQLADTQAYMVITTHSESSDLAEGVRRFHWELPDPESVLRLRMSTPLSDEQLAALSDDIKCAARISDIVELARRLDEGESPDTATRHFDVTAFNEVMKWFEGKPDRQQIAEVTTLAFALGAPERTFDAMLSTLEKHLDPKLPDTEPIGSREAEIMPQRRHRITGPGGLIVRKMVATDLGPRAELTFAVNGYHRHVVRMLWERYDSQTLWNAVRVWLDESVRDGSWRIALGLAALSEVAIDEVLDVIGPWSCGSKGVGGQNVAIFVLTTMAYSDELAPAALQIATKWITGPNPAQRWTAAVTFSWQLGVRYPHEATNRLWQLCVQAHTVKGSATAALAELFVTLTRETSDTGIVLTMVESKIHRFGRSGANIELRSVAAAAALNVLSAFDHESERRSLLLFLKHNPDRIRTVATLWATVLKYRPTRLAAIRLFKYAAKDLAANDATPVELITLLGTAIRAHFSEREIEQLRSEYINTVMRREKADKDETVALLRILLNIFDPRKSN